MKQLPIYFMMLLSVAIALPSSSCSSSDDNLEIETPPHTDGNDESNRNNVMKITIGSATFMATIDSNPTAIAFMELLPMTISMSELNSNEKYYNLPHSLPTHSSNPGTIKNGDLMLYGSSTFVLFYKTFTTSYSYTRIGSIDDPAGLENALGRGNITVTFERQ